MKRQVLIGTVVLLALVAGVGGVFYAFGTPEQQAASPIGATTEVTSAKQPAPPPAGAQSAAEAIAQNPPKADADAPPADPSVPLAIEIPGCRCHSDDPKLVKQHAKYRMNQCAGCHAGRVPTGE